jgi:transcriptional regulator with XRE-family HTH domain
MSDDLKPAVDDDSAVVRRLGDKLKKLREYLGMSQQYVAECTGVPRSAVSDIERGQRKVDAVELTKFARLYQQPVSWLLDEDERASPDAHALSLFTRKYGRLTKHDLEQLEDFAAFLAARRAAALEEDRPPEERSLRWTGRRSTKWP